MYFKQSWREKISQFILDFDPSNLWRQVKYSRLGISKKICYVLINTNWSINGEPYLGHKNLHFFTMEISWFPICIYIYIYIYALIHLVPEGVVSDVFCLVYIYIYTHTHTHVYIYIYIYITNPTFYKSMGFFCFCFLTHTAVLYKEKIQYRDSEI